MIILVFLYFFGAVHFCECAAEEKLLEDKTLLFNPDVGNPLVHHDNISDGRQHATKKRAKETNKCAIRNKYFLIAQY